jgi:hemerythrin
MEYEFNWKSDMSVGEDHIDEQHRGLLIQTNKIINAIATGNHFDIVNETLLFYDKYINEHFTYEEEYMKKIGFPDIVEHILHHEDFIKTYSLLENDVRIPREFYCEVENTCCVLNSR